MWPFPPALSTAGCSWKQRGSSCCSVLSREPGCCTSLRISASPSPCHKQLIRHPNTSAALHNTQSASPPSQGQAACPLCPAAPPSCHPMCKLPFPPSTHILFRQSHLMHLEFNSLRYQSFETPDELRKISS
uniref:Uncharacterized protein n=1 Tax=Cyanoderma ruficeps TaxID=181631 RepID=A0A8C3QTJ7_9PASS